MVFRDPDSFFNSFFYNWPQQEKPPISREIVYDDIDQVKGIRIQLALSGFEESDLKVWHEAHTLKVYGDNTKNKEINEKFRCSFEKTFAISRDLDPSKSDVKFKSGILEVFIPMAEKEDKRIFLLGAAK